MNISRHKWDQKLITEIFKRIFFELQSTDFSKIFTDRREYEALSTDEFLWKSMSQKKVTEIL